MVVKLAETIEFPEWVKVTKCRSVTTSYYHMGSHGVEHVDIRVDIRYAGYESAEQFMGFMKRQARVGN